MSTEYYSAAYLAGLPGMPGTTQSVTAKAKRENWRWQKRTGKGGGREYHFTSLPKTTQDHIIRQAAAEIVAKPLPEELPVPVAPPAMDELSQWQRDQMNARLAVISVIEEMAMHVGQGKAIAEFIRLADAEELPPETMASLHLAKNRSQGKHLVNRDTIYKWLKKQ